MCAPLGAAIAAAGPGSGCRSSEYLSDHVRRETATSKETSLFGTLGRAGWPRRKFAVADSACAQQLALSQRRQRRRRQRYLVQLEFVLDAQIAETRRPGMYARLRKAHF